MSDGSIARSVFDAADEIGMVLDRWQRYCVQQIFRTNGDRLAVRTALISLARQNGKTTLLELIIYTWLTRQFYGKDTTLLVSHDLKITSMIFDRVVGMLFKHGGYISTERRARVISYSFGRQHCTLTNGSSLAVQADTSSAGHGFAKVGLLVGDEIWAVKADAWDHGLLPTQRVHPSPLALMVSTAGDESSELFRKWRERGLMLIDTGRTSNYLMLEWSLPPGVDPFDEAYWGWANPCLGGRLPIETLRDESEAPDRPAFLRASLNCWISSAKSWLTPGQWDQLKRDLPAPSGGVLACEVSLDGERFIAVRAFSYEDATAVETAIHCDNESEFWRMVSQQMEDKTLKLAVTPSLEIHLPEQYKDRYITVGYRELGQWTGLVRSLIQEHLVVHKGEQQLSEHMNRAVATKSESGWALSTARSPGPIEAARCAVWAIALVTVPAPPKRRPAVAMPIVKQ